jgi:hypothetical protein
MNDPTASRRGIETDLLVEILQKVFLMTTPLKASMMLDVSNGQWD